MNTAHTLGKHHRFSIHYIDSTQNGPYPSGTMVDIIPGTSVPNHCRWKPTPATYRFGGAGAGREIGGPSSRRKIARTPCVLLTAFMKPSRTVVPLWGQITLNLTGLSPKRGCSSDRVKRQLHSRTECYHGTYETYEVQQCNSSFRQRETPSHTNSK